MSLQLTIARVLTAAGVSLVFPLIHAVNTAPGTVFGFIDSYDLRVSLPLSAVWLAATIYGILKYGKRGLWTMLGLSPAIVWPYFAAISN